MMKLNRNIISSIPIIMLVYSGTSNYITVSEDLYWIIGSTTGYSLFTDIFMVFMVFNLRFCIYAKIAVIGLCVLTLVSLLNPILNYESYAKLYDLTIVGLCLLFCIIGFLKKW